MGRDPSIEKEIDGEFFIFHYLPPRMSTKLLVRLLKIVGPSIGKAFPTSNMKVKDILDADIQIGSAVDTLMGKFNEDEVQDIIDILLSRVNHKGKGSLSNEATYTELFTGNLSLLFKVVGKALEVQYADFFGGKFGLKSIIEKAKLMSMEEKEELKNQTMIQEK